MTAAEPAPARPARRLLVVEDEPSLLDLLQFLIGEELESVEMVAARSISEALDCLRERPVDLILTDSFSPSLQDVFLPTEPLLRAAGSIPVVLLTAHRVEIADAQAAGFQTVLRKPFDIDAVLALVRDQPHGADAPETH